MLDTLFLLVPTLLDSAVWLMQSFSSSSLTSTRWSDRYRWLLTFGSDLITGRGWPGWEAAVVDADDRISFGHLFGVCFCFLFALFVSACFSSYYISTTMHGSQHTLCSPLPSDPSPFHHCWASCSKPENRSLRTLVNRPLCPEHKTYWRNSDSSIDASWQLRGVGRNKLHVRHKSFPAKNAGTAPMYHVREKYGYWLYSCQLNYT